MLEKERNELLREAMKLELNVCDLYQLYSENFIEDKEFWAQIAKEEKHHAALLEISEMFFDRFPKEIVYNNLAELKRVNKNIEDAIEEYKRNLPSKEEAYKFAFELENSAYELHYQQILENTSNSEEMKTFQQINDGDKDHAERIKKLLAVKS